MGKESSIVWAGLKKELDQRRWAYQRIESKVCLGIPDVNIHVPGRGDVWVELKYVARAGRSPSSLVDVGLRIEQYNWMKENQLAGRKVYLVAKVGDLWYLWCNANSWEMAKRPSPWKLLESPAHKCLDAGSLCERLLDVLRAG